MSSSVFFKFKSQKEPSRVEFDGTGISVFELKRDIIIKSGLGDGTDFDLAIYADNGKDEYDDDTTLIPRSTSVIARRLPPSKPGAGRAARYMSGKMPINMKNSSRKEQASNKSHTTSSSNAAVPTPIHAGMTEEEQMAALFEAQNAQWNATQDEMANQTPVFRPGAKKGPQASVPDRDPPLGYICYRCQEKGHWIQACPTNDDPNFDHKPRVKRTTGIPRSFLKTVEKPTALVNDGTMDDTKLPSGVMVNAEGDFVIAEPDKASWEKFQAKTNSSAAAQKAAAAGDKELQEMGLECSIDKRIFIDPMKTPCCEKTYCNECITNALIESDFTCPGCQTDGVLIDDLKPDVDVSTKIKNYLEEKTAAKKEADAKERSKSPVVKRELTPTAADVKARTKSPPPKPGHKQNQKSNSNNKSKSPPAKKLSPNAAKSTPVPAATPTGPNTKKRPADELLENPKIPKGPKAMQQQATQQKNLLLQQQQAMMTSMGGMPNFPMAMDPRGWNGMPNMMMPGMNGMPMMNMNGMNPMMNFGGYPNMYANMNGGGMGMNNGGGMNGGMAVANGFPNQQKTIFAEPLPNEEDNAYFRKPVNPHRHQGKQRRNRPSDYREL